MLFPELPTTYCISSTVTQNLLSPKARTVGVGGGSLTGGEHAIKTAATALVSGYATLLIALLLCFSPGGVRWNAAAVEALRSWHRAPQWRPTPFRCLGAPYCGSRP